MRRLRNGVGNAGGAWMLAWIAVWPGAGAAAQELELVGTIPEAAGVVAVHGEHAYLGEGPTLRVYDISDPAAPAAGGSVALPANIYDIDVAGSVAYVAMDFDGLATVDVSDPAAPRLLGTFRTPGQALSVALSGTTAAVANRLSGLELVDVSDPAAPATRASYFAEGYAIDVAADDSHAYVIDTPGGLSIVDLAAPGDELEAVGTLSSAEQPAAVAVTTARRGGTEMALVVLMSAESTLELVDVSNPATPAPIATYRDPNRPRAGADDVPSALTTGLVQVVPADSRAYMADSHPPFGVQVVDLSDPAAPTPLTSCATPGPPRDVAVSGALVLVAVGGAELGGTGDPGVQILRFSP